MSVQVWTFFFIFLTFGLYIGIAIWSRAGSTSDFYVAGSGVPPLANGMATAPQIGCLPRHLFPWQVLFLFLEEMALFI